MRGTARLAADACMKRLVVATRTTRQEPKVWQKA